MFKKIAIAAPLAVLALSSSVAFAAGEARHSISLVAHVPTNGFYVVPTDADLVNKDQDMSFSPITGTMKPVVGFFDVRNTNGSVHGYLEGVPKLVGGASIIDLKVEFNNNYLLHPRVILGLSTRQVREKLQYGTSIDWTLANSTSMYANFYQTEDHGTGLDLQGLYNYGAGSLVISHNRSWLDTTNTYDTLPDGTRIRQRNVFTGQTSNSSLALNHRVSRNSSINARVDIEVPVCIGLADVIRIGGKGFGRCKIVQCRIQQGHRSTGIARLHVNDIPRRFFREVKTQVSGPYIHVDFMCFFKPGF